MAGSISSGRALAGGRATYIAMLAPALCLLFLTVLPFLDGIYTSFTNEKLYAGATRFIGFDNYIKLAWNSVFWRALANTLAYAAMATAIQIPLGLAVALLLDVPGRLQALLRSTIVLPLLIPPVVAGLMWKTMMQPQSGVLNWLLAQIGLPAFSWLSDPATALVSVVVIDTWLFMPLAAIILLAGLQSVSGEVLEAARIDGANAWQTIRYIKLQALKPYIVLVAMFRIPDALKSLEIIYATTRGGPLNATRTLHVMAYEEAYRWSSLGRAMAIVFVLWLLSYVFSTILLSLWRKEELKRHDR